MIKKTKIAGFTLIELIVVIAIISLLTSIILTSLSNSRLQAVDSKTIQQVREFQNAIALFYEDEGRYPDPGTANGFVCVAAQGTRCYFGGGLGDEIPTVDPENPDFAALFNVGSDKFVNNPLIKVAEAAPIINYLAYNLIDVPVVTIDEGLYGGGIIYHCAAFDDLDNCSQAYVYWPTNKPAQKGTEYHNPGNGNGPRVYRQPADDPGAGDGGIPADEGSSYY